MKISAKEKAFKDRLDFLRKSHIPGTSFAKVQEKDMELLRLQKAWMKEWEMEGDDDDMPDISGGPSSLVYLVG